MSEDEEFQELSWDSFFMGIAFLSQWESGDPDVQVGACIANDKKIIVGVGCNQMPRGCEGRLPWTKKKQAIKNRKSVLESKKLYGKLLFCLYHPNIV